MPSTSRTEGLARRLEEDMNRRGLGPGDRYLTAAEAGRLFGVGPATANSAMCVLAERQLLVRYRSRGSFGGPKLKPAAAVDAPSVCVITRGESMGIFESVRSDEIISALRQVIGGAANIQFCFSHDRDALSHIRPAIEAGQDATRRFGVIAWSYPRDVYQYLIDNAVPTIVLGTPYAGQDCLPSIDYDNAQSGRLLMEYLIRRGHDRTALLTMTTPDARPGENDFFYGVGEAMSEAHRLPNTLRVRTLPRGLSGIAAEAKVLLAQPDRPTGVIARTEELAGIVIDVALTMGLAVPDDVEIVFKNRRPKTGQRIEQTQLHPAMNMSQFCEMAGAMLVRLWRGVPLEQKHVVVPVALCERDSI